MIIDNDRALTDAVLAVMQQTRDPRQREIMLSLVKNLHAFIRDVRLTEAEFRQAAATIAELGQRTTDTHNEVMLMAGSLGVSALVCLLNNGNNGIRETSQNLLGPFWRMHSPRTANGESIVRGPTEGAEMQVTFTVQDTEGRPIEGAEVDIWHSSPAGYYENQDSTQVPMNLRGKFTTNREGQIWFSSIKPAGYPIPTDGVVGRLLSAQARHPYRPAHVHALIFKDGFKTLTSQVYADDDPNLHTDVQFGVTRALVGKFVRQEAASPTPSASDPDGKPRQVPWYRLEHTFVMEPGTASLPRPPIK